MGVREARSDDDSLAAGRRCAPGSRLQWDAGGVGDGREMDADGSVTVQPRATLQRSAGARIIMSSYPSW